MLKFKFLKKEDITSHPELYIEKKHKDANGQEISVWVLDLEGAVDIERLSEFRNNNVSLKAEIEELKNKFDGIDPAEYKDLKSKSDDLRDAKLIKSGELDKAVANRTKLMAEEHTKAITKATEENTRLVARLTEVEINQAAISEAMKKGLRQTAVPDITARARSIFRLVDGKVIAYEADGKTIKFGKDGSTPYSISDWVEAQVTDAPHLFEASGGGGAGGSNRTPTGIAVNPWKKETFNLTKQMEIEKRDANIARRLKTEAGIAA